MGISAAAAPLAHAQSTPPADTGGLSPKPPASAFTLNGAYTLDLLGVAEGGLSPGTGASDLLEVSGAYDGAAHGLSGLSGLITIDHTFGSRISAEHVGALQSVSSSEASGATRLFEAWAQLKSVGGATGVKIGLVDLNSAFDVQETAALFLNASYGLGPEIGDTGVNGPSTYPTTALAVTGFYKPSDAWKVQLGVFDATAGDPEHRSAFVAVKLAGALIIAEVERRFGDAMRLDAGAWTYTNAFPSLVAVQPDGRPIPVHGNAGVYGLAEARLLPVGDKGGGLSGWVRFGLANGDINLVQNAVSAGLVYSGPMFGRREDEAGVAFTRAGFGRGAQVAAASEGRLVSGAETVIEATYKAVLTSWISLQPDLQYVIRPQGERRVPNAVVLGLRTLLTWSR
jgi:porin